MANNNFENIATSYIARGFSVIPIVPGDKTPLVDWAEYQKVIPSAALIAAWSETHSDAGIAIVTGEVSDVVVVDIDSKEGHAEIGKLNLPPTPTVNTGNGQHQYFRYPGHQISNKVRFLPGVDIRGDGGYVVAPPSVHSSGRKYEWAEGYSLKDRDIADFPNQLIELLEPSEKSHAASSGQLSTWVEDLLQGVSEGSRNDSAAKLTGHYFYRGLPESEVKELLMAWNERNQPPLSKEELSAVVDSIDKKASENSVDNLLALEMGQLENLEEGQVTDHIESAVMPLISRLEPLAQDDALNDLKKVTGLNKSVLSQQLKATSDKLEAEMSPSDEGHVELSAMIPGLIDLVLDNDKEVAFLVKQGDKLEIVKEYVAGDSLYKPPAEEQIPFKLVNGQEVVDCFDQDDAPLFEDVVDCLKRVSELPSEEHYVLLAAWVFHTYLLEKADYSPTLLFFAVAERGKSRTGKVLTQLAWRGYHTETLNEASIFRFAQNFKGSIFFDVVGLQRKAERGNSEDILLGRYERGIRVARVIKPEAGPFNDTVYYQTFGPTIIATNEPVHQILDTRCIPISMPQASRTDLVEPRVEDTLPLKARLSSWRAKMIDTPLCVVPKVAENRLGDILKPLHQIIRVVAPGHESGFKELVERIKADRQEEKAGTLEGEILMDLLSLENRVSNGSLPLNELVDHVNFARPGKERLTNSRVGRILKSLGIERRRSGSRGETNILWNSTLFRKLSESYSPPGAK